VALGATRQAVRPVKWLELRRVTLYMAMHGSVTYHLFTFLCQLANWYFVRADDADLHTTFGLLGYGLAVGSHIEHD
jgi:hypothetical protein